MRMEQVEVYGALSQLQQQHAFATLVHQPMSERRDASKSQSILSDLRVQDDHRHHSLPLSIIFGSSSFPRKKQLLLVLSIAFVAGTHDIIWSVQLLQPYSFIERFPSLPLKVLKVLFSVHTTYVSALQGERGKQSKV